MAEKEDDEIEEIDSAEAAERVHKEWSEFFTAKDEDMAHVIGEPDLKKLCLRVNCHVNMSRWNTVADVSHALSKQGRLEGKSPANIQKFLTKAVNRYKSRFRYTDEQIAAERHEDFRDLKRLNILRLQLWEREEQAGKASEQKGADEVEDDIALNYDSDDTLTESVDAINGTLQESLSDDEELWECKIQAGQPTEQKGADEVDDDSLSDSDDTYAKSVAITLTSLVSITKTNAKMIGTLQVESDDELMLMPSESVTNNVEIESQDCDD